MELILLKIETQILASMVQNHSEWLQAAPRTTLELLERLDLPVAYPWSEDGSWVQRLSLALWDTGYTPHPADDWNPHWYWLEGRTNLNKDAGDVGKPFQEPPFPTGEDNLNPVDHDGIKVQRVERGLFISAERMDQSSRLSEQGDECGGDHA